MEQANNENIFNGLTVEQSVINDNEINDAISEE